MLLVIHIWFVYFGLRDVVEILIIAVVLYYLYRGMRGTFAIQAALGLVILVLINALVGWLGLNTINFILSRILDVGVLAVFIIFQPEIRRLLYRLGRNTFLGQLFMSTDSETAIDEVVDAVRNMAHSKTGALIVFGSPSLLKDVVDVGVRLDARVNSSLLQTIFYKNTRLHDGAVIIHNDRIVAASCYLPLSQNPNISAVFGTRHRAAVGISESHDVFVVIVSEETGRISVAREGSLNSGLSIQRLNREMQQALGHKEMTEEEMAFSSESEVNLG
jgi:diadenylate cyclase